MSKDPNSLTPWERGDPLLADRLNTMQTATTRVEAGNGLMIVESGQTRVVQPADGSFRRQRMRVVRLTKATLFAPYRWRYDFARLTKADNPEADGGGWEDSASGETGVAYNLREATNTEDSWGIGVDPVTLPPGFDMGSVALHLVQIVAYTRSVEGQEGSAGTEWWFDVPNPIVGECQ